MHLGDMCYANSHGVYVDGHQVLLHACCRLFIECMLLLVTLLLLLRLTIIMTLHAVQNRNKQNPQDVRS